MLCFACYAGMNHLQTFSPRQHYYNGRQLQQSPAPTL
jgi:hypothetical protein